MLCLCLKRVGVNATGVAALGHSACLLQRVTGCPLVLCVHDASADPLSVAHGYLDACTSCVLPVPSFPLGRERDLPSIPCCFLCPEQHTLTKGVMRSAQQPTLPQDTMSLMGARFPGTLSQLAGRTQRCVLVLFPQFLPAVCALVVCDPLQSLCCLTAGKKSL